MPLLRIASVLLFAAMAIYGATLNITNFSQAPLRNLAADLLMRRNVTALMVHDAAGSREINEAMRTCRSDLLDDALSVILHDLNQTNQVADYDSWARSHARSQIFLQTMIRCQPLNGNAWIREAMVERAIAEDAESLRIKLDTAIQIAPFERQLVVARLSIWKRLSPRALEICAPLAETDIVSVLRYGMDHIVKDLPAGASDGFRHLLLAQLASIDQDRRRIITPLLGMSQ